MRIKLKGINEVRKKLATGEIATYYYHRPTGIRLVGEPGTPEFLASFQAAAKSMTQTHGAGTVAWLIRQYCDSPQWKKLAASTQEIGRLNLKAVEDKWGATPLEHAQSQRTRPLYLRWHDKMAATHPRAADAKLSALARVLSWGVDRGLITNNPVATFERAYKADRAEKIWLPEHVAAFNKAASPELRLALLLALHTGQRQGDLLQLPWSGYDGTAVSLRQGKSGRKVWIPATRALRAELDAAPRRAVTILTKPDGESWTKDAFTWAWGRAFEASEIKDDLHFHDLRGTAVTMLSEVGSTPQEIATITGHTVASVNRILETYLARTRTLAESAIIKLDQHRRNAC
ncbi:tyrosine-type recombinase/integrase [Methylobacterium nodulans]|uniref:Integrase family protein n=1 Tax=Methylobacterium nodulans (strain LMG 21967 / CNCM I-2342 / ORS 2060) TaxID=460265 RepID=B8IAQ2_METNO|nr:tyrosine-type recombinase/integrase [Methylobacterium nodulans]ACL61097.1 integrase family protein [Methylobacterium nodulans ORS 2060]